MDEVSYINLSYKYIKENYDYCWMMSRFELAEKCRKDTTLIVGSSHALNGIDCHCFADAINCSMHTQDINYDGKCIRKILSNSDTIYPSKCFVIFGYYIPFQDISMGSSVYTSGMMKKVYDPVFLEKDDFTWECILEATHSDEISEEDKRKIFDMANQIIISRKNYYNDLRGRVPLFRFNGKWKDLSEKEKDEYGQKRAADHNKHIKYTDSFHKNSVLLKETVDYLYERNIRTIIIIPPYTDTYNRHIEGMMKDQLKTMIDTVSDRSEYIDFNDMDAGFTDDDFVDTDHLNGRGAYKMSMYLADKFGR